MAMFIGFVDGDGLFDIGEQKQYDKKTKKENLQKSTIRIRLGINLHIRDVELLRYFVSVLGQGKIDDSKKKIDQVRLIFYKHEIVTVIMPLIELYNLRFLTTSRQAQYSCLLHIFNNNLIQWKPELHYSSYLNKPENNLPAIGLSEYKLTKLVWFSDWVVGFTMAEAWFGIKHSIGNNSRFFQIRQTGFESLNLLKAICLIITNHEARPIKPDKNDSYQLVLSSKADIIKVEHFFTNPAIHPLYGYKKEQYDSVFSVRGCSVKK